MNLPQTHLLHPILTPVKTETEFRHARIWHQTPEEGIYEKKLFEIHFILQT